MRGRHTPQSYRKRQIISLFLLCAYIYVCTLHLSSAGLRKQGSSSSSCTSSSCDLATTIRARPPPGREQRHRHDTRLDRGLTNGTDGSRESRIDLRRLAARLPRYYGDATTPGHDDTDSPHALYAGNTHQRHTGPSLLLSLSVPASRLLFLPSPPPLIPSHVRDLTCAAPPSYRLPPPSLGLFFESNVTSRGSSIARLS